MNLGEKAIVAEGAVMKMNQKVPAGVVVAGNPATVIRNVSPEEEEKRNRGKQLYINLAKKYLEIGLHPIRKSGSKALKAPSRRRLKK